MLSQSSSDTRSFVHSNQLVCAYCGGKQNDHRFRILNDEQYTLICEGKPYGREDYFCLTCIGRLDAKLNRHKAKEQRKRRRSVHGTTNETENPIDPNLIEQNPRRKSRRDGRENEHPNASQPASSQDSLNRTEPSQRSAERAATVQPSTSKEQMPPPRRVATKSTAGRHRLNRPPPLQPSPSRSTRSHPITSESDSDIRPIYEVIPPGFRRPNAPSRDASLDPPTPHGTPQQSPISSYLSIHGSDLATPPRSLDVSPRRSHRVTTSGSPGVSPPSTRPQGALPGPSAPMPKNRPIRHQDPHPILPRRPGESVSEHRERLQRAHREFHRGGSG